MDAVSTASKGKTFDIELGRHDLAMGAIEPGLQLGDSLRDCREIAPELRHHCLDRIIDRRFADGSELPVPYHDLAFDNDMAHAAPSLNVNELTRRTVHRRECRVLHVDQWQGCLAARRNATEHIAQSCG